jgi:hypothetical protein
MAQHDFDDLFQFSKRLLKIEYMVIKLVFWGLSLYGLYRWAKDEVMSKASPAFSQSSHYQERRGITASSARGLHRS